jgi:hypothetical protein
LPHASQHLLLGPPDHHSLSIGSELGALGFARREGQTREQRNDPATSHP